MRFRRLDLIAYGHFTNVQIDLSKGQHGLHLIYGPNEAGKSSSLRALTDFLFGIPVRTSDAFLHPYATMRIGGILENQKGDVLHCIRRKANQGSLRNASEEEAIPDAEWNTFLGDIHRDLFTTMFGINHETLREGGEEIARGGGRTGEALFSSASGLTGLRNAQKTLRDKMDAIFSASGRRGSLLALIQASRSVRDDQRKVTISMEQWKAIEGRHAQAQQQEEQLKNRVGELERRQLQLGRIRSAIPVVAQWSEAQRDLSLLESCVSLPEDFGKKADKLLARKLALNNQRDELVPSLAELRKRWGNLPKEYPALDREQEIEELLVRSGEYRKGQSDLPRLKTLLENEEHEARETLREMGRAPNLDSIESVRLASDRQTRIQTLANQYSALLERVQSHTERLHRFQRQRNLLVAKAKPNVAATAYERLRDAVARVQRLGPMEDKLEALATDIEKTDEAIARELQKLGWGDRMADEVWQIALPEPVQLEAMDDAWKELNADAKRIETDQKALIAQHKQLSRQCALLDADAVIPSRDQLREARELRDTGWELLAPDSKNATRSTAREAEFLKQFPIAMDLHSAVRASLDAADHLADRMLEMAERVNEKQQKLRDLVLLDERLDEMQTEQSRLAQRRSEWDSQWHSLWHKLAVEPKAPREMRQWLQRAMDVQRRIGERNAEHKNAVGLQQTIESCRSELSASLQQLGKEAASPTRLDSLLSVAEMFQREVEAIRIQVDSDREQLTALEREENEETDKLHSAQRELEEWRKAWMLDMQRLGLEADALPEQAAVVVQQIQDLLKHGKESETLRKRIQGIERDADHFLREASALAVALGHDPNPNAPGDVLLDLKRSLQKSREENFQGTVLFEQIQRDEDRLRNAESEWCALSAQLQAMVEQSRCSAESELESAAERSRTKRDTEARVVALRSQIIAASAGEGFEPFVELVKSTNIDSAAVELQDIAETLEQLKSQRDIAIRAAERERHELESLDRGSASELESQAQGIAASIDEQLRELAVLRLCAAVLNTGLERFRDKNQGPMLNAASDSFRGMTCGAFEGLRIDLSDDGQGVLVGIRSNQKPVHVQEMSDGTRDQLYLSLRMAAIKEWNARHEPIPLIVDDILVHFDDDRSVATLEQLAELSDHTQVIFFTHHQHLLGLATARLDHSKIFAHRL